MAQKIKFYIKIVLSLEQCGVQQLCTCIAFLSSCNSHHCHMICCNLSILFCVFLILIIVELFRENDAEGKEAILSALQRLQYDPDRDVRYFAGVEEDALDLTYEGQMTSLDSAQDDLQEVSYALEEDCELENLVPNDEGESRANEVVTINEENKTETFNNTELLEDFHQTTLEELSSSATVFGTNLESTAFEFEEDERRLDLQSQDLTNAGNTSEELDKDVKCGEEREPQCSIEVLIIKVVKAKCCC